MTRKRFKKLIRGIFAEFSPLAKTLEQQNMMSHLFETAMKVKISPFAASKCTYYSYKQLYQLYFLRRIIMTRKRFEKLLREEYTWFWVHSPLSFSDSMPISRIYRDIPKMSALARKMGGYDTFYDYLTNP